MLRTYKVKNFNKLTKLFHILDKILFNGENKFKMFSCESNYEYKAPPQLLNDSRKFI